jgi:hypothetical protein
LIVNRERLITTLDGVPVLLVYININIHSTYPLGLLLHDYRATSTGIGAVKGEFSVIPISISVIRYFFWKSVIDITENYQTEITESGSPIYLNS